MDLLHNLFPRSCAAVDRISTDTARRAVRLRQQSFLFEKNSQVVNAHGVEENSGPGARALSKLYAVKVAAEFLPVRLL